MAQTNRPNSSDRELSAIGSILTALDGLEGESIQRVLDYVFSRLSLGGPSRLAVSVPAPTAAHSLSGPSTQSIRQTSIRDLKEGKEPESSNQMAALVAYYLSEVAPEGERKDSVNAVDLEKYFKQAGFKLPKSIPQTLPNATAAGYFDPAGNGYYKLNPVGYNLVVHGLPRSPGGGVASPKRPKAKSKKR